MKQRIITGLSLATFFALSLFTLYTAFFPFMLSILSVLAVYEIQRVIGLKNFPIRILSYIVSVALPFIINYDLAQLMVPYFIIYIIIIFLFLILDYDNVHFSQVAIVIFTSISIPFAFGSVLLIRDFYVSYPNIFSKNESVFFILLAIFSAGLADAFAYFIGSRYGKHKLSPKISPKKSIEGAIGGLVGAPIMCIVIFIIYKKFLLDQTTITYLGVGIASLILSVISMIGDLAASTLKRNYNAKDFSNILPGHGGIMDRFDSQLFVLPTMYAIIELVVQRW